MNTLTLVPETAGGLRVIYQGARGEKTGSVPLGGDAVGLVQKIIGNKGAVARVVIMAGQGSFSATRAAYVIAQVLAAVGGAELIIKKARGKFYAAAPHITRPARR